MKINILGTDYKVVICSKDEDERLANNIDLEGYTDFTTKRIVILDQEQESEYNNDIDDVDDLSIIVKRVLRHELVHALFYESGLDTSTSFARDELLIDFIALQLPKLCKLSEELNTYYDSLKKGKKNEKCK